MQPVTSSVCVKPYCAVFTMLFPLRSIMIPSHEEASNVKRHLADVHRLYFGYQLLHKYCGGSSQPDILDSAQVPTEMASMIVPPS